MMRTDTSEQDVARFIHKDRLKYSHLKREDYYLQSMLFQYLRRRFGEDEIIDLFKDYGVGVTLCYKSDGLYGNSFIYRNIKGRALQVVEAGFDPNTGQLLQDADVAILHTLDHKNVRYTWQTSEPKIMTSGDLLMEGYDFIPKPSLWGMDRLKHYPNRPIGIVKSEKTALELTLSNPSYTWLATGLIGDLIECMESPDILEDIRCLEANIFVEPDLLAQSEALAKRLKGRGYSISVGLLSDVDGSCSYSDVA